MSAEQQPAPRPDEDFWKHKTPAEWAARLGAKPYDPASWPGVPEISDEEMDWWIEELRALRRGDPWKEPPP